MPHKNLPDEDFLSSLQSGDLNPKIFNHEAHLRLAYILSKKFDKDTSIEKVMHCIHGYVNHLGAQDKYHMTLTIAAVKIVHHFMEKSASTNFNTFIKEYPQLNDDFKRLLFTHYSKKAIESPEAKLKYIKPDLLDF